jgi:hypothetical protein
MGLAGASALALVIFGVRAFLLFFFAVMVMLLG